MRTSFVIAAGGYHRRDDAPPAHEEPGKPSVISRFSVPHSSWAAAFSPVKSKSKLHQWLTRRAVIHERFLEQFWVRVVLSFAIILSLVPAHWVSVLDPIFLVIFGAEFVARLWSVMFAPQAADDDRLGASTGESIAPARSRVGQLLLLFIDFVALTSFLPIRVDAAGARFLRVFRLTRMILLIGYWAPARPRPLLDPRPAASAPGS